MSGDKNNSTACHNLTFQDRKKRSSYGRIAAKKHEKSVKLWQDRQGMPVKLWQAVLKVDF